MPFLDWFLPCFYAFAACLGFCVPFNIRGLGAVICSLGGGLAWLVYLIAGPLTGYHDLMQYFWAAVFLSAYSEGMARVRKCPVTEERQEVMDFSESYATGIQVVIVKEDSPIETVDDLANADMIGCQKATTGYIYCSDTPENGGYGEDHVTAYETGAVAVQALVNGQVDAVVIDNEPAKAYVAANPGLKILDTEFAVEDYAIALQKGNTGLLEAVNAAMDELKADGTFQTIVDKYITAE